jgi:hypothetical protein
MMVFAELQLVAADIARDDDVARHRPRQSATEGHGARADKSHRQRPTDVRRNLGLHAPASDFGYLER